MAVRDNLLEAKKLEIKIKINNWAPNGCGDKPNYDSVNNEFKNIFNDIASRGGPPFQGAVSMSHVSIYNNYITHNDADAMLKLLSL